MDQKKETRILIILLMIGYGLNFCFGMIGSFFPPESFWQMTCWQIGDSLAVMASVLASRYIGSRGQNLAAAGYTMLAIAYGVSFASSSINAVNEEKMATVTLPLVPAMILVSFCTLYPKWLRAASVLVCIPFFFIYQNVREGTYRHDNLSNTLAYAGIQLLGVLWSIMIWKDFRKN
jgi:hypothetical protein